MLAFEHAVVAAYLATAEVLRGDDLAETRTILEHERQHVRRLSQLIESLARRRHGRESRTSTDARFRGYGPEDALRFAEDLEQRLVRALSGGAARAPDPRLRREAAAIATAEAEHLGRRCMHTRSQCGPS